ncbi:branched-chain amino acid ABC transporter permease [Nocardia jiangxiensis]|uniref:branched-chain amino acid ABC transporter permease n=1 Tax=Nocardia jiangxiensis TaxID=282685 RepID=UPI00031A9A59|nr:ABC transporter permease [Nocardia jiangxiensis]
MDLLTYASLGLSTGGAYALVALGLVAAYRGTGVIDFAQGALGMFGAYLFWKSFSQLGIPVGLAIVIGVVVSAAIGVGFFALVGRRLAHAPAVTKILITIGLMLVLEAVVRIVWTNHQQTVTPFVAAGGFEVAGVRVQSIGALLAGVAIVATVALHLLFTRTAFGHITTALRDTDLGAQSIGINPRLWGSLAWGLAGALAAVSAILLLPITQLSPTASTTLLVPALGAALAARFTSFPIALSVGLGTGVLEGLCTGLLDAQIARAVPDVVALVVLLLVARTDMRRGTREVQAVFHVGSGRIRWTWLVAGTAVVLVLIGTTIGTVVDALSLTAIFGLVALGIVVSIGYTGQVNALPLGISGVSMIVFGAVSDGGGSLLLSTLAAVLTAVAGAFVLSGLFVNARIYEVTIGALAVASILQAIVFSVDFFFNGSKGWTVGDTTIFGADIGNIGNPRGFAVVAWLILLLALIAVANLRRSSVGRYVLSVRQDERLPAALGVVPARAKFIGLVISSVLWGVAGALLAVQRGFIAKGDVRMEGFDYADSLALIAFVILAGSGYLVGAVLAGAFAPGGLLSHILSFAPDVNDWLSLFFAANMIWVLATEPDGVVGQFLRLRDGLIRRRPALTILLGGARPAAAPSATEKGDVGVTA